MKKFHVLPPIRPLAIWGVRIDGKKLVLFSTAHKPVVIVPASGGRKGWDVVGDI